MNKQFYKSNFANEIFLQNTISYVLTEIFNLMKVCYGPYGSHVLIANKIGSEAMKDGQRILSSFIPDSSIANSVLQSVKSVSNKQAEEIGDGTTTTMLLLCQLYEEFRKIITENNISPSVFNKHLKDTVDYLLSQIKSLTMRVVKDNNGKRIIDWDMLRDAVYTSVDANEDLTNTIIEMYKELDSIDPLIIIDTHASDTHRYELVKGIELEGSPISPEIFFNGYSRKDVNLPNIVVVNGRLDLSVEYIMELDQRCMQMNQEYIFLSIGINDEILSTLVTLKNTNPALLNRITFFQIKTTASNDDFLDICASLGANPVDSETFTKVSSFPALMKILDNNSGSCEKSLVTEFCIRFNDPNSSEERVAERIAEIDSKIDDIKNDPTSHNDRLKDLENRKAFLTKNFAKLYIGGTSPQRRSINYELAKDGVLQATSCLKNGVVYGCNTLIHKIINHPSEMKLEKESVEYKMRNLILNAIDNAYVILFYTLVYNKIGDHDIADDWEIMNSGKAPNLRDNDETPVYNSAATDVTILKNATDMAALLATSKAFLSNIPEFDSLNNQ